MCITSFVLYQNIIVVIIFDNCRTNQLCIETRNRMHDAGFDHKINDISN